MAPSEIEPIIFIELIRIWGKLWIDVFKYYIYILFFIIINRSKYLNIYIYMNYSKKYLNLKIISY
jgi:hypothetical protein